MPREISIEMPFAMGAAAFWALRMDRNFDVFCAHHDKMNYHPESHEMTVDAEGLVYVQQRNRLQMKENPVPKSVRGMVGSGDDFSYRVHYRFHRDAFDEAHPFCYTTEFPVLSDRIKVEGRQWLEPISPTACTFRAVIQLSILLSGVGGAAERAVEKSMRSAYNELAGRAAKFLAQGNAGISSGPGYSPMVMSNGQQSNGHSNGHSTGHSTGHSNGHSTGQGVGNRQGSGHSSLEYPPPPPPPPLPAGLQSLLPSAPGLPGAGAGAGAAVVAVPAGTAAAGQLTGKATGRHELAEPRRGGAEGRRGAEERRAEERPFLELVARCVAPGLSAAADTCAAHKAGAAKARAEVQAWREEGRRKDAEIAVLTEGLQGCILQLKAAAERSATHPATGHAHPAAAVAVALPAAEASYPGPPAAAPPAAAPGHGRGASWGSTPWGGGGGGVTSGASAESERRLAELALQVKQRDSALGVASAEISRERKERHDLERLVKDLQAQLGEASARQQQLGAEARQLGEALRLEQANNLHLEMQREMQRDAKLPSPHREAANGGGGGGAAAVRGGQSCNGQSCNGQSWSMRSGRRASDHHAALQQMQMAAAAGGGPGAGPGGGARGGGAGGSGGEPVFGVVE